ncbi:MAG: hypothetical protein NTY64_22975 [Deltaproteobacteria bacterium]|nr:hypothetical protein [Deltaproteobacteria bacterium]
MSIFMAIAILGPIVLQAIQLVEKLVKGKGKGKQKKKMVMDNVLTAWQAAIASGAIKGEMAQLTPQQLTPIVSMIIDTGAGIYNAAGSFAGSAKPKS